MAEKPESKDIRLLQFMICEKFHQEKQDSYVASQVRSNLYVSAFPHYFAELYVVTWWRKDERFHKEVIEYSTDYGKTVRSPHMDIEPLRDSVLFRWHTHHFPTHFPIEKPTTLHVKVILDWEVRFESDLLIEQKSG